MNKDELLFIQMVYVLEIITKAQFTDLADVGYTWVKVRQAHMCFVD